jgi:uncharacterized membrane protein YjjB (DUF3815 family)
VFYLKVVAVLLMSTSVGVLYRIPRGLLFYAGLAGLIPWLVTYITLLFSGKLIFAVFLGSMGIGLMAELMARLLKKPAIIFIIPGFFPLVPGGEAYTTMLHLVEGRYFDCATMAVRTFLVAGAIAAGIFTGSTIYRIVIVGRKESKA